MKNKKKHLQKEERFLVEKMIKANKSFGYIAKLLDRGISTISLEVDRNGGKEEYDSNRAQIRAIERQSSKKVSSNKLVKNKSLRAAVLRELKKGLSPEQIALNQKNKKSKLYSSGKSIRKYLSYKIKP